jgi:hypothetical protein
MLPMIYPTENMYKIEGFGDVIGAEGHFTHETESMWPLHFKHSHWWKRRSRSKFASHYAWGTSGVCECKMDVKFTWIPIWHQMDHISYMVTWIIFKKPLLGNRPNTKPWDRGTLNAHNCWCILFYHVWGTAWIKNSLKYNWLRAQYMWLHTTLEDPWPLYIILEVPWDGLWTLSFRLSQFHGHGS